MVDSIPHPAVPGMNSAINFIELDNRVISATYRNLMIGAQVHLVDNASGKPLPEPVTKITSPIPSGTLRILSLIHI